MRRQTDEAYVLATLELGEADLIVTLLSAEQGKVRGVARAARSSRRRFGGALEPLTRVRATWSEREGRELHRLEGLELLRSFAEMQAEPIRLAACAVLAEISQTFSHEGEADPRGFRLLGAVLEELERGTDACVQLRYFEYWTLRLHGLLPDLAVCAACGRPLVADAPARLLAGSGLCCLPCAGGAGRSLGRGERRFLAEAERRAPADLSAELAAPARAGGALEQLLRGTLEGFAERPFRTYRHLRAAAELEAPGSPR